MRKMIFTFYIIVTSLLLLVITSFAVGRIEITGLSTGCPSGFSLLISGTKRFCEPTDPKIVDAYIESSKNMTRCPLGYESSIYGKVHWCVKRAR